MRIVITHTDQVSKHIAKDIQLDRAITTKAKQTTRALDIVKQKVDNAVKTVKSLAQQLLAMQTYRTAL